MIKYQHIQKKPNGHSQAHSRVKQDLDLCLFRFSISLFQNPKKMVESELSYEQIRLNRVEENKKRMGELNLNKLAQSLRVSSSSKSSPVTFPFSSLPHFFIFYFGN